jgi:hypothetical protein
MRVLRTGLQGWKRYKEHTDARIRRRFTLDLQPFARVFPAAVEAVRRYYRDNPTMRANMAALLKELVREFGWKARLVATLAGPYVLCRIRREEKRLSGGLTYEPPIFYERNDAFRLHHAEPCRFVTPGDNRDRDQQAGIIPEPSAPFS